MLNISRRLALGLAVAVMATPAAAADNFTLAGKTVTWIVGFKEGGGTDRLTRVLQSKLAEHLPGNPEVIVLNKPGGGSVTASNDFHANAPNDGTTLIMASTSGLLPPLLGAKVARYDPNQWVAVAGFSRGATMFGISDQLGVGGSDAKADYAALRRANIRFGLETPISAEMLDLVSLNLLDIDARVIFGLSSKDAEAALARGEMNMNTDNTRSYLKDYGNDPEINPVWSYGVIAEDGSLLRDPDLPDVPTFPEFYEAVKGREPAGPGYELQRNLMNAKVMLSKSVMLPPGTPDHIRDAYVAAMKKVVADPDVAAKLPREVGSMPVNFGDATQRAIALGTAMSPEVREWADAFLWKTTTRRSTEPAGRRAPFRPGGRAGAAAARTPRGGAPPARGPAPEWAGITSDGTFRGPGDPAGGRGKVSRIRSRSSERPTRRAGPDNERNEPCWTPRCSPSHNWRPRPPSFPSRRAS